MADTRIYNARLYPNGAYYMLYWDIENPTGNTLDIYLAYSSDNKTWTSFRYNSGIMETMSGMIMSISAAMVPAGNRMRMRIGYKKNSSSTAVDTYSNWTNIVTSAPTVYAPSSGSITLGSANVGLYANEFTDIAPNLGPGRCPGSSQTLYAFDPTELGKVAVPLAASVTVLIPTGAQFMGVGLVYRGVDREGKYNLLHNLTGGWSGLNLYTDLTPTYGSSNTFTIIPNASQISSITGRIEQGETIQFGAYIQYASGPSAIVPLKNLLQSGGCTTIWKNPVTSDVAAPVVFTSSTASKPAKAYIYSSGWQITGAAPPTNYFHPDAIAQNANLKQGYAIYLPALDLVEGKYYYLVDGATQATCYNDAGTTWTKNGSSTTTSNTTSTTYFMHLSASTSANGFYYKEAYPWLVLRASATSAETENTILGYMPRIYASS